jgi:hypothetical protein
MIVSCPSCGAKIRIPDQPSTYTVDCPACLEQARFQVKPPQIAVRRGQAGPGPQADRGAAPRPAGSNPPPRGSSEGPRLVTDDDAPAARKPAPTSPGKKKNVEDIKPAATGRGGRPAGGPALPLLEDLVESPQAGTRRWLTLACLSLSAVILAGSATLAALKVAGSGRPGGPAVTQPAPAAGGGAPAEGGAAGEEELRGGIEIGAKGVKAVVLRLRQTAHGVVYDLAVPPQTANTTLVAGLAENGIFARSAVEDTARAVGRFHERFRGEHKIPAGRIHICGSSGLLAPLARRAELLEANKRHLNDAVRKETGQEVGFVDAVTEMGLSYRACVPARQLDESLLIDLGSGSTKISYTESGGARLVPLSVPFGSVSLADEVERRRAEKGGAFSAELAGVLRDHEKLDGVRAAVRRDPGLTNQKHLCLVGGVVWALATLQQPWARGAHVPLTRSDVEAFVRRLEACPKDALPEPEVVASMERAVVEDVKKDVRQIRKQFTREQLLAGARLLLWLHAEVGGRADKEMLFARNGYLGLAIGYVLHCRGKGK